MNAAEKAIMMDLTAAIEMCHPVTGFHSGKNKMRFFTDHGSQVNLSIDKGSALISLTCQAGLAPQPFSSFIPHDSALLPAFPVFGNCRIYRSASTATLTVSIHSENGNTLKEPIFFYTAKHVLDKLLNCVPGDTAEDALLKARSAAMRAIRERADAFTEDKETSSFTPDERERLWREAEWEIRFLLKKGIGNTALRLCRPIDDLRIPINITAMLRSNLETFAEEIGRLGLDSCHYMGALHAAVLGFVLGIDQHQTQMIAGLNQYISWWIRQSLIQNSGYIENSPYSKKKAVTGWQLRIPGLFDILDSRIQKYADCGLPQHYLLSYGVHGLLLSLLYPEDNELPENTEEWIDESINKLTGGRHDY